MRIGCDSLSVSINVKKACSWCELQPAAGGLMWKTASTIDLYASKVYNDYR